MTQLQPEHFHFNSDDGLSIACVKWKTDHRVRGIVQIAHGLGEHVGRYAELAETLAGEGFVVFGNDHRGHGLTAEPSQRFGDFGPAGFDGLVEDMVTLRTIAKREYPHTAYILLGHSMGSFAAQQFVLDHSHSIDGVILSGSGDLESLARAARGSSAEQRMDLMNRAFAPARTPFDWLTRDATEVDAFIHDPLCFPALQARSMQSFLDAWRRLADPRELRKVREDLPIYIFSGSDDPVGQQLNGVQVLMDRYRNAGLASVAHDFYPGGRHDMLHELNRREVLINVLGWISSTVASGRGTRGHAHA